MDSNYLEARLINFSVKAIEMTGHIKKNYAGNHLSQQLIRSCTSVSLNFGEARGAESRKDLIQKYHLML